MIAPKLRFQGFVKDLEQHEFRDFIKSSKYGPRFDAKDYDINGNVKTIRGTDVSLDATIKYEQVPIANLPQSMIDEHRLQNGDILMITTADCGLSAVFEKQEMPYIASAYAVRICLNEKMDSHWAKYYLQTNHITNEVNKYIRKGTLSNLPLSDISRFIVNVPALKEQTKIAEFLSAVDDKISQLSRQIELLNQYKKGVMQKIFSQEIRFKNDNGEDFGEWETDSIENVFTNKSKKFNPVKNKELPCIELEHLSQDTGMILGTISSLNQKSIKNYFKTGDILYGKLRPYLRKFARPNFDGVCSTEIWVLDGIKVSNSYLFQFVQSEQFSELTNIQSGSKMPRAEWSIISNSEIEFPTKPEQKKIAEFLTAIDERIDHTTAQLTHTKQWKKGLLQQMFI